MAGHEAFFDGRILVEVTVGTDGMPKVAAGEGGGRPGVGGGESRGRRGGGGHGQMGLGGGGGGYGGNISGNMPFGGGGEGGGPRGGMGGPRMGLGGGGRPVMIHLRFTNQGSESVTLMIDDFTSPLGNFAVRPEKLVLEPGKPLETEPMTSQLAGAFAEVDATLVLRIGDKGEKKTFRVGSVKPPASSDGEGGAGPQAPNPPKS